MSLLRDWVWGLETDNEVTFSIILPCPSSPSPQFPLPSHKAQIFPLFPLYIIRGLSVGFSEAIAILYDQK
ncbi:MAG: hypothetical protein V7L25_27890 [Nostoc sp.]